MHPQLGLAFPQHLEEAPRPPAISCLQMHSACLTGQLSGTMIFITKWFPNYKRKSVPLTDLRQRFQPGLHPMLPWPPEQAGLPH